MFVCINCSEQLFFFEAIFPKWMVFDIIKSAIHLFCYNSRNWFHKFYYSRDNLIVEKIERISKHKYWWTIKQTNSNAKIYTKSQSDSLSSVRWYQNRIKNVKSQYAVYRSAQSFSFQFVVAVFCLYSVVREWMSWSQIEKNWCEIYYSNESRNGC